MATPIIGTSWQADNFGTLTVVGFETLNGIEYAIIAQEGTTRRNAIPIDKLERQIYVDTKNLESRTERRRIEAVEKATKAQHDHWFGFTDAMSAVQAGKAKTVLEKRVSFGHEPGERGLLIAEMIRNGYRIEGARFIAPDRSGFYEVTDLTKTGWAFAEYVIARLP